jgi:hypothetical protein
LDPNLAKPGRRCYASKAPPLVENVAHEKQQFGMVSAVLKTRLFFCSLTSLGFMTTQIVSFWLTQRANNLPLPMEQLEKSASKNN